MFISKEEYEELKKDKYLASEIRKIYREYLNSIVFWPICIPVCDNTIIKDIAELSKNLINEKKSFEHKKSELDDAIQSNLDLMERIKLMEKEANRLRETIALIASNFSNKILEENTNVTK